MKSVSYTIPAIHCGHCVHTIKMELSEMEGVESVDVEETSKQATVKFAAPASEEKIVELLKEINYPPEQLLQI